MSLTYSGRMSGSRISSIGRALSDPGRAQILSVLTGGVAQTAGQLAKQIGRSPSTTSRHLSELIDSGLIAMEPDGRNRYFRLAGPEVAELLERIEQLELVEMNPPKRPAQTSALAAARSCYDHIAGRLGVGLYESLVGADCLAPQHDGSVQITESGHERFAALGIDTAELSRRRRPMALPCLDWTQRTHHLGGSVGAALMTRMFDERWVRRQRDTRILVVTDSGRRALRKHFDLALD